MARQPPTHIGGTEVEVAGRVLKIKGRTWRNLIPTDETDLRVWEWCQETGHTIQTMQEDGGDHE
jgi:hypothetical protein